MHTIGYLIVFCFIAGYVLIMQFPEGMSLLEYLFAMLAAPFKFLLDLIFTVFFFIIDAFIGIVSFIWNILTTFIPFV